MYLIMVTLSSISNTAEILFSKVEIKLSANLQKNTHCPVPLYYLYFLNYLL